METLTYAYAADIVKSERDANGDLLVYGKATGPDRDADGQRCDPDWLKTAVPEWFQFANIREMHQPVCAGVGVALTNDGDDWYVKSMVVDPGTAKKIEAGALKGYSIGVKSPIISKRGGDEWIAGGEIVEISYVDRPCNPTTTMAICKAIGASGAMAPVEATTEAELTISVGEQKFTPADLASLLVKNTTVAKSAGTVTLTAPEQTVAEQTASEPAADQQPADAQTVDEPAAAEQPADEQVATEPVVGEQAAEEPPANTEQIDVEVKGAVLDRDAITKAILDQLHAHGVDVSKGAMAPLKPGGAPRYPIKTVQDLKDAIQSFGRGKDADKAEIKNHIKSEAKRLGRSDLIPDNWKALLVKDAAALDTDSSGMTHDPAELRSILQGLVDCLKAEADELVAGDNELFDLSQLLRTISAFLCWWDCEAASGETESPYNSEGAEMAEFAATPDVTKTATPTEGALQTPEPSGSTEEQRLTELVKSAVADATKAITAAAEERNTTLTAELETVKADLAKALALPEPGGPVITRTAGQEAVARQTDALRLQAQANELLAKAATATDPYLAQGYRERAAAIAAQAAA